MPKKLRRASQRFVIIDQDMDEAVVIEAASAEEAETKGMAVFDLDARDADERLLVYPLMVVSE